jgi:hypothetical protein
VGVLLYAALLTLWPPLAEALLRRPLAGAGLQAVAGFAGLDAMLPVLGLSTRTSLWIAVAAVAVGLPLSALAARQARQARAAAAVGALVAAAIALGGARAVPPAPVRFVGGGLGTAVAERELVDPALQFDAVPAQLVCLTSIAAPSGLHDRLRHVWTQDGVRRATLWLDVRGGRSRGFRTWSYRRGVGPGQWTCTVETAAGQELGRVSARVDGAATSR